MIDYRAYQSARWHSSPFQSNVSFVTLPTRIVASVALTRLLILAGEEIAPRAESETEAQCPALSQMRDYVTDRAFSRLFYTVEIVVVYVCEHCQGSNDNGNFRWNSSS